MGGHGLDAPHLVAGGGRKTQNAAFWPYGRHRWNDLLGWWNEGDEITRATLLRAVAAPEVVNVGVHLGP